MSSTTTSASGGACSASWPTGGRCSAPATIPSPSTAPSTWPTPEGWRRRLTLRRWYGFLGMQIDVARRYPRIVTVSASSKRDIVEQMGIEADRLAVVPIGADQDRFRPRPEVARVPGRIMTTASADVPLKGLVPLLEAVAKLRTERPDAHLVVIGKPRPDSPAGRAIERLGLDGCVEFARRRQRRPAGRAVRRGAGGGGSVALRGVLPACGRGHGVRGAAGGHDGRGPARGGRARRRGRAARSLPGDPGALAVGASAGSSDDPELAARLAVAGRRRVLERFTWRACAETTAEHYRWIIEQKAISKTPMDTAAAPC